MTSTLPVSGAGGQKVHGKDYDYAEADYPGFFHHLFVYWL